MADEVDIAQDIEEAFRSMAIRIAASTSTQRNETGVCVECGEHIDPRRLKVMPGASRCIDCA